MGLKLRVFHGEREVLKKFYVDNEGRVWLDSDPHGVDMSGRRRIFTPTEKYRVTVEIDYDKKE